MPSYRSFTERWLFAVRRRTRWRWLSRLLAGLAASSVRRDGPWSRGRCPTLSAAESAKELQRCPRQPLVSLVVCLGDSSLRRLDRCLRGIHLQHYANWELLLVYDEHASQRLRRRLEWWSQRDSRIRCRPVSRRELPCGRLSRSNHIWSPAKAANEGLALAAGSFVGFLDPHDHLPPDALTWLIAAHNDHPSAQWIYGDETRSGPLGLGVWPFFKPDYSPVYLLSTWYTGPLNLYRTDLLRRIGGLRQTGDGAHHHDLALRVSEHVTPDQVKHVPRIVVHRGQERGRNSFLGRPACIPRIAEGRQEKTLDAVGSPDVVAAALCRRGLLGRVELTTHRGMPIRRIHLQPRVSPPVSIIIPTHNGLADLQACLASIRRHTRYPDYQIVVIDNRSDDPALLAFLDTQQADGKLRVTRDPRPFNHSVMNSDAVAACDSPLVVLMNNDVQLITDDWLETLVATVEIDSSVAGVGAMLLYPDRTVQHGGLVMGIHGVAGHAHKHLPANDPGYFGSLQQLREVSGATAALLLLRRSAFLAVGGFDAERYPTSYNDVDLWLRLRQAGYGCLYNPLVQAIHHESKTRRPVGDLERSYQRRIQSQWGSLQTADPFYNPNLPLDNEQYLGWRRAA